MLLDLRFQLLFEICVTKRSIMLFEYRKSFTQKTLIFVMLINYESLHGLNLQDWLLQQCYGSPNEVEYTKLGHLSTLWSNRRTSEI